MKKRFGLIVFIASLLSACGDGIPKVKDPSNPVDDKGNTISGREFLNKYCVGNGKRELNETCQRVLQANRAKSSQGKMPEGW